MSPSSAALTAMRPLTACQQRETENEKAFHWMDSRMMPQCATAASDIRCSGRAMEVNGEPLAWLTEELTRRR